MGCWCIVDDNAGAVRRQLSNPNHGPLSDGEEDTWEEIFDQVWEKQQMEREDEYRRGLQKKKTWPTMSEEASRRHRVAFVLAWLQHYNYAGVPNLDGARFAGGCPRFSLIRRCDVMP